MKLPFSIILVCLVFETEIVHAERGVVQQTHRGTPFFLKKLEDIDLNPPYIFAYERTKVQMDYKNIMEQGKNSLTDSRQPIPQLNHFFTLGKQLGSGSFGAVFEGFPKLAKESYSQAPFAIKALKSGSKPIDVKSFKSEAAIHFDLASRLYTLNFIPQVLAYGSMSIIFHRSGGLGSNGREILYDEQLTCLVIVMLKMRGSLEDLPIRLTKNEVFAIMAYLFKAMEAIHLAGYIHRDIKPDNIFYGFRNINGYYRIEFRVGDFGFAVKKKAYDTAICGTPEYQSPEALRRYMAQSIDDCISLLYVGLQLLYDAVPGLGMSGEERIHERHSFNNVRIHEKYPTFYYYGRDGKYQVIVHEYFCVCFSLLETYNRDRHSESVVNLPFEIYGQCIYAFVGDSSMDELQEELATLTKTLTK